MTVMTFAMLILPGKHEAWLRFIQEMRDLRSGEYQESRRRVGITEEAIWLVETLSGDLILINLEVADPEAALKALASSELPFDRWYCDQLQMLHGLNIFRLLAGEPRQLMFKWNMQES